MTSTLSPTAQAHVLAGKITAGDCEGDPAAARRLCSDALAVLEYQDRTYKAPTPEPCAGCDSRLDAFDDAQRELTESRADACNWRDRAHRAETALLKAEHDATKPAGTPVPRFPAPPEVIDPVAGNSTWTTSAAELKHISGVVDRERAALANRTTPPPVANPGVHPDIRSRLPELAPATNGPERPAGFDPQAWENMAPQGRAYTVANWRPSTTRNFSDEI